MKRENWVDHTFNLGIGNGWIQNVMSRIRDTGIRLAYHSEGLTNDQLSMQLNGAWSIKEHIGHLTDLEPLWMNRFGQFEQGVPELVHADMSNKKTAIANHNDLPIATILDNFHKERNLLIEKVNGLSETALNHVALHPRLQAPMQPVDLLFFVADHDDHHITSIMEIKTKIQ